MLMQFIDTHIHIDGEEFDADRAEVTRTVRRVVDKLLHTPTVQVKKLSSEGGAVNYAEALAVLAQYVDEIRKTRKQKEAAK